MGFKLVALSSFLLTVSALSIEHNAVGGGCVDLLCPDTASLHGLRNLVNEDTLKTDACTTCRQCTENGYSVCLKPRDSRASRNAGGCTCAHTLAANCHTDLAQTQHPANLSMKPYTSCYADALQRPPQPLAVNENSSVVVTIEPFWLEPYWRHLKVENVTLHYKFQVKAPEDCEGEVETTATGVHTCVASILVDLSEGKEEADKDSEDDYDHSDNYDQYDDDLPPEVPFDRGDFSGAKLLESYYTATIRRARQIKPSASKDQQIYDKETIVESEHLKFDLKPEVYGTGESQSVGGEAQKNGIAQTTQKADTESESATVVEEDKDEGDVSEEIGGTNFFEEEEKKEDKEEEQTKNDETSEEEEEEEEEGVLKVNLQDIEPTKLKSQEDAKKKIDEEGDDDKEEKENNEIAEETTVKSDVKSEGVKEEEHDDEHHHEEVETAEPEITAVAEDDEDDKDSEEQNEETTTMELVEGETVPSEQNFIERIVNGPDFPRVRNVFIVTLGAFIVFCCAALCCLYKSKCCKSKESKTSNGYRYTSANPPPTELKAVPRVASGVAPEGEQLLAEGDAMEKFRNVVRSGTTFNPNKVELGIVVGKGEFGPIHRAMFNSYNGSVHDVNVYMLKQVARLSDEELVRLTSLLKANISAGAHQNVVSLCGISTAGSDVMLMWEPLHQSVLRGVLRESRCARFGTEPFNMASFLSSERLAAIAIGCCNGVEHLLKKSVFPTHLSTSNVLLAERGIVKIGGFGLAEHHALDMTTEKAPTHLRWMPPEYFRRDQKMIYNEQTIIWPLGVTLWEIFSLGATPFASLRQVQAFIDAMRDGSAQLEPITYCGEAVSQLLSTCTSHVPEARGDIRTIIKRLECISADAKTQINLSYREDFPYLPIVTPLEQQTE